MSVDETRAEPQRLFKGDSAQWRREFSDAKPADGYTLKYRISGKTIQVDLTAVTDPENPNGFLITLGTTESATLDVQNNNFAGWLEWTDGTARRRTIFADQLEVDDNPATVANTEESHVRRMLAAIEAAMEQVATSAQKSYMIGTRRLDRMELADLKDAREYYKRELQRIQNASAKKRGQYLPRTVGARFSPQGLPTGRQFTR